MCKDPARDQLYMPHVVAASNTDELDKATWHTVDNALGFCSLCKSS